MAQGTVYNIQRMSIQDGPGIRTTVFLKGCPLHCLWCSNPESQTLQPQLLYFKNLCMGCGACMTVCPQDAVVRREDGKYGRNLERCTNCAACTTVCRPKARELSGKVMSVREIMDVVRKDAVFYANSGGGLTIGGGEPTLAGDFFLELLRTAREEALHVAVDTCGFCPEDRFAQVLELADLLLFDCKHMNPVRHMELTGQDNILILRNLRAALESGVAVRIRVPLIPGMNDGEENLADMAHFLGEFGRSDLDLIPCHMFGRSKYQALGKRVPQLRQYTPEELKNVLERMKKYGLDYTVI